MDLWTLLITCCCVLAVSAEKPAPNLKRIKPKKPHIVFMVADDLGYNDVGYHGSEIRTPTIDSLAYNGVRLENYYVQPMCSPSRAALMTGRYPIHLGLQHEVIYAGQRAGLPLEIKTLAQELKGRGYATHGIGKWHLGFFTEEYLPTKRGFDSWKGYLTGNEDYYTHKDCQAMGCGFDFRVDDKLDYNDTGRYSTLVYTERAKEIITKHDAEEPLFLYMPYQAVHFPMQVPESYTKPYDMFIYDRDRKTYAGMMSCLDESVANVTGYLKERGMWEDTVLIFSTDNGGETARGGNNWPLRGKKWTLWEGGIRGVAFVHSPLLNRPYKTIHNSLMHISDWYPTIVEGILGEALEDSGKLKESLKKNAKFQQTTNSGETIGPVGFDGMNMWDSISDGSAGLRTELLHNIDPLMPHPGNALYNETFPTNCTSAIRVGEWKLLTGAPGVSKWFPPLTSGRSRHTKWLTDWFARHQKLERVISGNKTERQAILDYDTTYHTAYDPYMQDTIEHYDPGKWTNERFVEHVKTENGEPKNVWLYNITADPEEIIDLSDRYPGVVKQLLNRLAFYNLTAVKPNFPGLDPAAKPDLNNGTWSPWLFSNGTMINGITLAPAETTSPATTKTTKKTTTTATQTSTLTTMPSTSRPTTASTTQPLKDKLNEKAYRNNEKDSNRINKSPRDLSRKELIFTKILRKVAGYWRQAQRVVHNAFNH